MLTAAEASIFLLFVGSMFFWGILVTLRTILTIERLKKRLLKKTIIFLIVLFVGIFIISQISTDYSWCFFLLWNIVYFITYNKNAKKEIKRVPSRSEIEEYENYSTISNVLLLLKLTMIPAVIYTFLVLLEWSVQ